MGFKINASDQVRYEGKAFANFSEKFTHYSFMGGRKIAIVGNEAKEEGTFKASFGSVVKDILKIFGNVILFPLTIACLAQKGLARRAIKKEEREGKVATIRKAVLTSETENEPTARVKIGIYLDADNKIPKAPNGEDVIGHDIAKDALIVPKHWEPAFNELVALTKDSIQSDKLYDLFMEVGDLDNYDNSLLLYKMLQFLDTKTVAHSNRNPFKEISDEQKNAFKEMLERQKEYKGVTFDVLKEQVNQTAARKGIMDSFKGEDEGKGSPYIE